MSLRESKWKMSQESTFPDLALDCRKAVEAVDFVAQKWRGVTQYYVCKIMYFADKEHCLDWGRTITGDKYVAMDHGPVPSRVYEMLKPASGEEDEILEYVSQRLMFEMEGNKIHIHSKGEKHFPSLSDTDKEYLESSIKFCRPLGFGKLRRIAHAELAWRRAAETKPSSNPTMDLADWFEAADMDRDEGAAALEEHAKYGVR